MSIWNEEVWQCLFRTHFNTNQAGTLEVFMEWKFETLFIDNPFMLNITTCNAKHTCYLVVLVVTCSVKHCENMLSHNETFIDTDQNVNLFEDWKSNLSFM